MPKPDADVLRQFPWDWAGTYTLVTPLRPEWAHTHWLRWIAGLEQHADRTDRGPIMWARSDALKEGVVKAGNVVFSRAWFPTGPDTPRQHQTDEEVEVHKGERETVIRWDSESKVVVIDSLHSAIWRRVERAGFAAVRTRVHQGREIGRVYHVPLANFRFRVRPLNAPRRPAPPGAFGRKTDEKTPRKRQPRQGKG